MAAQNSLPAAKTTTKTTTTPTKQHQNNQDQQIHQTQQESHQQQQPQQQQHQSNHETGVVKKLVIDSLLYLIKSIIFTYDLLSQPIFYFKHEVYRRQHQPNLSCQENPDDPNSAWRQINIDPIQDKVDKDINSFEYYDEMMKKRFQFFGDRKCYGYRNVLEEQWIKRGESDKLFRKVKLTDFNWITFKQFNEQIEAARKGFLLEGIRAGDKVMLYADTRPEWQISSQALIRLGAVVSTMYATLGVDGIIHSVNETEVTHVVTQRDKVNKLLRLKAKLPNLKKIIYFEPVLKFYHPRLGGECAADNNKEQNKNVEKKTQITETSGNQANGVQQTNKNHDNTKEEKASDNKIVWVKEFEHKEVECMSFSELLMNGFEGNQEELEKIEKEMVMRDMLDKNKLRTKDSIAVIMYTSGSTGIPKGVLISHGNIMATVKSFSYVTKDIVHKSEENICSAYLPLAHIFEFCIESVMLYHGVKYGFATPHTLTDKSPGLMAGQQGDLTLLKPTVLIIVPLILDRIVLGVKQALSVQSYFKQQLVTYLINYKSYWQRRHYETPIVDKIVCSKIRAALGGQAKYVICGSAPLGKETQTFVRAALNLQLPQGFGTTETCAATSCQLFTDQSTGNVGLPVLGAQIKLEPWIEGNYRPTDKPYPRGEIVVGGEVIAHGYFKLDDQTKESFYVDERGVRWYRTGDIGEFLPNGNLKIIDRKKDLVKLQNGEYISLGKVESTLKSNPYTDNFCIYANSSHNYVVALGPANEQSICALAQQIVDEYQRKSPTASLLARNDEERSSLLLSDHEQQLAIDELKEVLQSYELDKLNNNNEIEQQQRLLDRKMSSLSTTSQSGINERLKRLCENQLVQERFMACIHELARERNLMTLEVPKKMLLLAEEWTEDKNLVTAAMKLRRNFIYKRYEQELGQLYRLKPNAK